MKKIADKLQQLKRDERGASMVEYALVVALVGIGAAVVLTQLGTQIQTTLQNVVTALGG